MERDEWRRYRQIYRQYILLSRQADKNMQSAAGGCRLMTPTVNFGFLSSHDPMLVQLGGQAERYFREDPAIALFKLRQFAELLSKIIAARHALYRDERETFEETLRKLSFARVIPKETADVFHFLRRAGNA